MSDSVPSYPSSDEEYRLEEAQAARVATEGTHFPHKFIYGEYCDVRHFMVKEPCKKQAPKILPEPEPFIRFPIWEEARMIADTEEYKALKRIEQISHLKRWGVLSDIVETTLKRNSPYAAGHCPAWTNCTNCMALLPAYHICPNCPQERVPGKYKLVIGDNDEMVTDVAGMPQLVAKWLLLNPFLIAKAFERHDRFHDLIGDDQVFEAFPLQMKGELAITQPVYGEVFDADICERNLQILKGLEYYPDNVYNQVWRENPERARTSDEYDLVKAIASKKWGRAVEKAASMWFVNRDYKFDDVVNFEWPEPLFETENGHDFMMNCPERSVANPLPVWSLCMYLRRMDAQTLPEEERVSDDVLEQWRQLANRSVLDWNI